MNSMMEGDYEKIAEGLAAKGYAWICDFLSTKEVDAIRQLKSFKDGLIQFKKAGIGREKKINSSIRGDYIEWIDRGTSPEEVKVYLRRLQDLMMYLNQALFLSLKDYELHMTIYPAGSRYERHLDQFKANDHRRLSVICYLNQNWKDYEGGQLRLYSADGVVDILPKEGRLICFRSDQLEHEVLPATRDRLSLTGWFLDQFAELRQL